MSTDDSNAENGVAQAWERILRQAVALNTNPEAPASPRRPPSLSVDLDRIWQNLHNSAPDVPSQEHYGLEHQSARLSFLSNWLRSRSRSDEPSQVNASVSLDSPTVWERMIDVVDRATEETAEIPPLSSPLETRFTKLFLGPDGSTTSNSPESKEDWAALQRQMSNSAPPARPSHPGSASGISTSRGNRLTRWLWGSRDRDEVNRAQAAAWLARRGSEGSRSEERLKAPPMSARAVNALENLVNQIRAREDHEGGKMRRRQMTIETDDDGPAFRESIDSPGLKALATASPAVTTKMIVSVCNRLDRLRSANEASVRAARPPLIIL